jgi:hypothetical protein
MLKVGSHKQSEFLRSEFNLESTGCCVPPRHRWHGGGLVSDVNVTGTQ